MKRLFAIALLGACTESFPMALGAGGGGVDPSVTIDGGSDDATIADATQADAAGDAAVGSTVEGDVKLDVDGGAAKTSVLLAREGDFALDAFYDRLPSGPFAFDVSGAFSIPDVPAGTYWVLAGYGNDGLVSFQAGPTLIAVSGAKDEVVHAGTQYLTRALKIAGILPKASAATVTIVDTEGEDEYRVTVIDFMNELVYSQSEPSSTSGGNLTFAIGAPLTVPFQYRVRVRAMKGGVELTRTEDLKGVFTAQPDDT